MYNLIRKDFLLLVNYFILSIPASAVFVIAFTPVYPHFGYAMSAFAIAFMLTFSVPSQESRNHSDVIVNSLPVLRSEIITAKYLSPFLYTLISLLMVALVGLLANLLPLPWHVPLITWLDIVFAVITISLMASVYYPFFYKFYNNVVILLTNIFLFQLIFFMPNFIISYVQEHPRSFWIQQLLQYNLHTPWALPLFGLMGAALLLIISYNITLKIYSTKDF